MPRHQEIVARILGDEYAAAITRVIGVLEVLMVIWILSGYRSKLNAVIQITIILLMNIIELLLAKDLLLFGAANIVFAFLFSLLIYYYAFRLKGNYVQS